MKRFNEFIGEGVRDRMTPKSEEDIRNSIRSMSGDTLFKNFWRAVIYDYDLDIWFETGVDINMTDKYGSNTVLHELCWMDGTSHVVKKLLDLGADPNMVNRDGQTPLIVSVINTNIPAAKVILNSEKFEPYKHNQIQKAIDLTKKDEHIRKILIDYELKQPLTESVRDKMTPRTSEEIEERLNGLGIDNSVFMGIVKECSKRYESVSMKRINDHSFRYTFRAGDLLYTVACFRLPSTHRPGQWKMKVIVTEGRHRPESIIDINSMDDVQKIVERGREVLRTLNEGIRDKMTPKSDEDVISSLHNFGEGERLFRALEYGLLSVVKRLIEVEGINPQMPLYGSALKYACKYGPLEMVKYLVEEQGMKPNNDCILYATQKNHPDIVKYLMEDCKATFSKAHDEFYRDECLTYAKRKNPDLLKYFTKTNESLRDKMTPKDMSDIEDSIGKISKDELNNRLVRAVSGNDIDTLRVILPYVDLNYQEQELELCELAVDLSHITVFNLLLKKGVSDETSTHLIDYINTQFGRSRHREVWLNLVKKYQDRKNEGFHSGRKTASVNDSDVKEYREIGPKRFQMSFSGFVSEGVRDKMTPKSKKEIMDSIRGMTFKSTLFTDMLRCAAEKYDITSVDKFPSPMYQFSFRVGDNVYIVTTSMGASNQWMTRLTVGIEPNTKYNKHNHRYNYTLDHVTSFRDIEGVIKSYEDVNESIRDKMTPKPDEEVRKMKSDILEEIVGIVKSYKGGLSLYDYSDFPTTYPITIGYDKFEDKGNTIDTVHRIVTLYVDSVKISAFGVHNGRTLSEYYLNYGDLEPDILLKIRKMLRKITTTKESGLMRYNESVRDMMTPKSKEDIIISLKKSGKLKPTDKLEYGAKNGKLPYVREAIEKDGLDPDWNNGFAMRLACVHGHANIVKYLLEMGADRNMVYVNKHKEDRSWTPIQFAESFNHRDIVNLLDTYFPNVELHRMNNKIKSFFRFNESVRDKMTPISKEDIQRKLSDTFMKAVMEINEFDSPDEAKKWMNDHIDKIMMLADRQPAYNIVDMYFDMTELLKRKLKLKSGGIVDNGHKEAESVIVDRDNIKDIYDFMYSRTRWELGGSYRDIIKTWDMMDRLYDVKSVKLSVDRFSKDQTSSGNYKYFMSFVFDVGARYNPALVFDANYTQSPYIYVRTSNASWSLIPLRDPDFEEKTKSHVK